MQSILQWWQQLPFHISPVLFDFGFVQIRWYGLMYFLSFFVFYLAVIYRLKTEKLGIGVENFDGFMTYAIFGAVIGARLGYVLFYNFSYFLSNPLEMFWPYQKVGDEVYFGISGLSYHGGLIGVAFAVILFCGRRKFSIWKFADIIVPAVPLGYIFGRVGNFLNGELFGRVTGVPWGMYFPGAMTPELRHPSQLYEAFGEGLLLFCVLWAMRRQRPFDGYLFAVYLFGYGLVRFVIEFFRAPDEHLGLIALSLSMGQILCVAMMLGGVIVGIVLRNNTAVEKCQKTKVS